MTQPSDKAMNTLECIALLKSGGNDLEKLLDEFELRHEAIEDNAYENAVKVEIVKRALDEILPLLVQSEPLNMVDKSAHEIMVITDGHIYAINTLTKLREAL